MLVRDIVLTTQRLNAILPPAEQLASLHLSPLQATPGGGKATLGIIEDTTKLLATGRRGGGRRSGGDGGEGGVAPTRLIVKSGMATDQGRRYTMEDAHVLLDQLSTTSQQNNNNNNNKFRFYAVYDGHGGSQSALFSGKLLHKILVDQSEFAAGDYEAALRNAYRVMDQQIMVQSEKHRWNDGTTAVTVLVVEETLYIANVGDSEAVLGTSSPSPPQTSTTAPTTTTTITNQGTTIPTTTPPISAVLLTQNHKPNSPDERHRIEQAGGVVIFGRVLGSLAVSRALGDFSFKAPINKADKDFVSAVPFVKKVQLKPQHDTLLVIACDGLWDVVTYEEAVMIAAEARQQGKTAQEAAKHLVQTGLIKGSQDNLTIIVLYLSWPHLSLPNPTTTQATTTPNTNGS
jgi:serine/threonine protein phosphatase PrpC